MINFKSLSSRGYFYNSLATVFIATVVTFLIMTTTLGQANNQSQYSDS